MLTERGELHVIKRIIFMDWLPPIEVSRISDGAKGIPLQERELFLIQSYSYCQSDMVYPSPFPLNFTKKDK